MAYTRKIWKDGEVIYDEHLNRMEEGIVEALRRADAETYTHPDTHPASMITETELVKMMTAAERIKLEGIPDGAIAAQRGSYEGKNTLYTTSLTLTSEPSLLIIERPDQYYSNSTVSHGQTLAIFSGGAGFGLYVSGDNVDFAIYKSNWESGVFSFKCTQVFRISTSSSGALSVPTKTPAHYLGESGTYNYFAI